MIEFRQKVFNVVKKGGKKVVDVLKKEFNDRPVGTTLAVLGTTGTGVNIALNTERKNNEKKFYKSQIKSTNELTNVMNDIYQNNETATKAIKNYNKHHTKKLEDPVDGYIKFIKGSYPPESKNKKK